MTSHRLKAHLRNLHPIIGRLLVPVLLVLSLLLSAFANSLDPNLQVQAIKEKPPSSKTKNAIQIDKEKLDKLDAQLQSRDNIWLKRYENFKHYHRISMTIEFLEESDKEAPLNSQESHRLETLRKQKILLEQYSDRPFGELLDKPVLEDPPSVNNPFEIFGALSYIKHLSAIKEGLQKNEKDLEWLITILERKQGLLQSLIDNPGLKSSEKAYYKDSINELQHEVLELQSARNILETTIDVFDKDSDEVEASLGLQIKNQILKLAYIGVGILFSIVIAFLLKVLVKRYIHHHERAYTTSKVINVFNITIIFLILLFAYLDNATYAVALLGFASAGLAIAMKDLFMSTLGWLVIVVGGSVHVGDRIRIKKENEIFVGDVLDISMLRITIYDDITLTAYRENHRAGRVIFIPNNYIFTHLFANYTHGDLSNVWDSVEVRITFDSNISLAKKIALDIATAHAKIYTDQTRSQMRRMRDRFSLVHSALNVDPRVFNFIKENGMEISVWFQNYAYATLNLKSLIAEEIVKRYLEEEDIHLAYPITRLVYSKEDGLGGVTGASFHIS